MGKKKDRGVKRRRNTDGTTKGTPAQGTSTTTKPDTNKTTPKHQQPAYSLTRTYETVEPESKSTKDAPDTEYAELLEVPELSEKVGFPCFLVTGDVKYLDRGSMPSNLCYIIGGNGTYLFKQNALFPSLTKVDGIGALTDMDEACWYQDSLIPRDLVINIVAFFKSVYDKFKSEAIVLLYHNPKTLEWQVLCPEQTVSGGSANYIMVTPDQVPDGFRRVGTWHSHANMSAFFSGVDDHDDEKDDGLHLTLGDLGTRYGSGEVGFLPSVVASYASNGHRWDADPHMVMDAPVKILRETSTKTFLAGMGHKEIKTDDEFVIKLPEEELTFPEEWMEKVSRIAIVQSKKGSTSGSIVPFSRGTAGSETGLEYYDGYGCYGYGYQGYQGYSSSYGGYSGTRNTFSVGCSECAAYQTRTSFGSMGEVVDLLSKPENQGLLLEFMNTASTLYETDAEGNPMGLTQEQIVHLSGLSDDIGNLDATLPLTLNLRDMLWLVHLMHDDEQLKYFNGYYDWWIMNNRKGPAYCVDCHSEANAIQAHYGSEYEPIDFSDEFFLECSRFVPFGGFSWDAKSWNGKMKQYQNEREEILTDPNSHDEAVVYTDAVCADCVLFEATVTAGSANVQCDRYTELLANLGTDAAVDFATVDSFALHCPHLIDSWDDVLPEREDEDEEEVGYVSDGDLTTDDYLKAMYIEAMEKREE